MQIRCPHCQNGVELVDDSDFQSIDCPSCGSQFGLVDVDEGSIDTLEHAHGTKATIAHFELVSEVGRGAFGSVWHAHDSKLDRKVAIKVPRPGQFSQSSREQFLREARAAAQLNHPNIVSIYEVGLDDDRVYIVSDFVEGVSLADLLSAQRLSPRDAMKLCVKVALALEHAHENGVIHRDLKPANIMLGENNEPFVMDFGLAKREAGEITMTLDGKLLGTPAYMPPEQARGEGHHVDRRADVYSVGVILYELLTGELPFRGTTRMLLHQVMHEEAPSPRKLNNAIPRDLETICLKCLEKEPGKRYDTCAALAEDLEAWLDHKPIKARPSTWMERSWRWCKRKPAVAALSASMLMVLVGATVISTVFAVNASREAQNARTAEEKAQRESAEANRLREEVQAAAAETQNLLYISDMKAVEQEWDREDYNGARKFLIRHEKSPSRNLEWEYWHKQLFGMRRFPGRFSIQKDATMINTRFSSDGTLLVGGVMTTLTSDDWSAEYLAVWDTRTGHKLHHLSMQKMQDLFIGICDGEDPLHVRAGNRQFRNLYPGGGREILRERREVVRQHSILDGPSLQFVSYYQAYSIVPSFYFVYGDCQFLKGDKQVAFTFFNTTLIWDLASGELEPVRPEIEPDLTFGCVNSDGTVSAAVVTGEFGRSAIEIYNIQSRTKINVIALQEESNVQRADDVFGICFDKPGENLAISRMLAGEKKERIQLFNLEKDAIISSVDVSNIRSIAFSPHEPAIWGVEDETNDIVSWNYLENTLKIVLPGEKTLPGEENMSLVAFTFLKSSERIALSVAEDMGNGYIDVWDVSNQMKIYRAKGFQLPVGKVSVSPDGKWIAACSGGPPRMLYASSGQGAKQVIREKHEFIFALSSNAQYTLAGTAKVRGDSSRTMTVFDTMSGKEINSFEVPSDVYSSSGQSAVHDDGYSVAFIRAGGGVQIFSTVTGKPVHSIDFEPSLSPIFLEFTTDPFRLIINARGPGDASPNVFVEWDMEEEVLNKPMRLRQPSYFGEGNIWTSSDYKLFVVPESNSIAVKEFASSKVLHRFTEGQNFEETKTASVMDISRDRDFLAVVDSDNGIQIWNLKTGKHVFGIGGHRNSVSSLRFSPDATRLVSISSSSNDLKVWDLKTGSTLINLQMVEPLYDIRFANNGNTLLGVVENRKIILWDLRLSELEEDLQK